MIPEKLPAIQWDNLLARLSNKYTITYDVVAGPSIVLHYNVDEFSVEGGETTRQDIVRQER